MEHFMEVQTARKEFYAAARAYCKAWTRDNRNNFTDGPGRELTRTRSAFFNAYRKLMETEGRSGLVGDGPVLPPRHT